jgi:hypothetical protein
MLIAVKEQLRQWLRRWLGIEDQAAFYSATKQRFEQDEVRLRDIEFQSRQLEDSTRTLSRHHGDLLEEQRTLTVGQDALAKGIEQMNAVITSTDLETRQFVSEAIQNLQQQITELGAPDSPLVKSAADHQGGTREATGQPFMPGHVRFSDRKRAYEASKRKPLETSTGKQIEENSRLIASGTRKTE